jgi:hypothetical protein
LFEVIRQFVTLERVDNHEALHLGFIAAFISSTQINLNLFMQTHNFENLLQVESHAIAMLRAAKTSVAITRLQEELPDIENVHELISQLAFLEKN